MSSNPETSARTVPKNIKGFSFLSIAWDATDVCALMMDLFDMTFAFSVESFLEIVRKDDNLVGEVSC